MKIISEVVDFIKKELEGAEEYANRAILYRESHPSLARTFHEMSLAEMGHVDMLHGEVAKLIEEHRRTKGDPPPAMAAIWDHEHKKLIKKANHVKVIQSEYK